MEGTGLDVHYVAVDSRARDGARYPDVSEYVMPLNYTLRDVESIEIMALQLARGEPNVHAGNRTLGVTVGSAPTSLVALDARPYSPTELVAALQAALQSVDANFSVTVDGSQRLRIAHATTPFRIDLRGSMDRLMGFPSTRSLVSGEELEIYAPYPLDLSAEPYVLLYINDWDRYIGNTRELDQAFFMIPFEERGWRQRFHICNSELEKKGIYLMNNTHRNLAALRIRFARPDGTNYDFGGIDHQMVLRITVRNKRSN